MIVDLGTPAQVHSFYQNLYRQIPRDRKRHVAPGLFKFTLQAKEAIGDTAGVIKDYDRTIELNPKCWDYYDRRGHAKEAAGDQDLYGSLLPPEFDRTI